MHLSVNEPDYQHDGTLTTVGDPESQHTSHKYVITYLRVPSDHLE